MVIEIVSESDPGFDYREKHPRYREARIEEIWIVNPFNQTVFVDKLGERYKSGKYHGEKVPAFARRSEPIFSPCLCLYSNCRKFSTWSRCPRILRDRPC